MTNDEFSRHSDRTRVKRLGVFCGARNGKDPAFLAAARQLGRAAVRAGLGIVYGGGGAGLMGAVARAAIEEGGEVIGVTTQFLLREEDALMLNHKLIVVQDMTARKRELAARADAFVVLPGGLGTLEELAEQISWAKLRRHAKPVVLIDAANYWQPLLALFDHMAEMGFRAAGDPHGLVLAHDADEAIAKLLGVPEREAVDTAPPRRPGLPLFNEISPETSRHEVFHCPDAAKAW